MYRVLIVDDEPWALRGIQRAFQWKEWGFDVIAALRRSEEALEMIIKEKPDVVFTDIRMPKISGIELMQRVRDQGLDVEFILVSGFSDFSYAQQALRLGASDYCLKPLESENTDGVLKNLRQKLENKNRNRNTDLFDALTSSKNNVRKKLEEVGFSHIYSLYQAVVVIINDSRNFDKAHTLLSGYNKIKIVLGDTKIFYFLNTNNDVGIKMDILALSGLAVGISQLYSLPEDIVKMYAEADISANNRFIYGENRIIQYRRSNNPLINQLFQDISSSLEKEDSEPLKALILKIPDFFKENELGVHDLCNVWNQLVSFIKKKFKDDSRNPGFEFMNYQAVIYQFEDISAFSGHLLHQLLFLREKDNDLHAATETSNIQFNRLIKYVQTHSEKQLYLRDLSKAYFLNQTYCSFLFKKHVGSTFTDYINKLRVQKAKELLKDINYSIDDVSRKIGYNDYYYFIKVFKKYYGVSPSKYRKAAKGE